MSYQTPEINVVEVVNDAVLCQSPGTITVIVTPGYEQDETYNTVE